MDAVVANKNENQKKGNDLRTDKQVALWTKICWTKTANCLGDLQLKVIPPVWWWFFNSPISLAVAGWKHGRVTSAIGGVGEWER